MRKGFRSTSTWKHCVFIIPIVIDRRRKDIKLSYWQERNLNKRDVKSQEFWKLYVSLNRKKRKKTLILIPTDITYPWEIREIMWIKVK